MDGPGWDRKSHPQRLIEVWQGEADDYMPLLATGLITCTSGA
jgi:hypothetical protein